MELKLKGLTETEMLQQQSPLTGVRLALEQIRPLHYHKGSVKEYQAGWIYVLARPYNRKGANILEIGTLLGYSAAALALAAPQAQVVSLNPTSVEAEIARKRLASYKNVSILTRFSWDYLEEDSRIWDMIFVDGDHRQISRDMPWFNRLKAGGLMLFHDYSPAEALSPCLPVYEAIQAVKARGRELDIEIVDNNGIGMAGFYRRDGENW